MNHHIDFISFVGIDTKTSIDDVRGVALYAQEKKLPTSFGLLYSEDRQGRENRYPSYTQCMEIVEQIRFPHKVDGEFAGDVVKPINPFIPSVHLCGSETIDGFMTGDAKILDLTRSTIVQLNFKMANYDEDELFDQLVVADSRQNAAAIVIQYNKSKASFCEKILEADLPGVFLLHDASGGFGRELTKVSPPFEKYVTGYAGGLKPSNIRKVIEMIEAHGTNRKYYLDMESGVRENNWFSTKLCRDVIDEITK